MLELGFKVALAYMIGSVMGALVVGRLKGGVDIRTLGSGNAGGTNALRTQGKAFAFWVMVIDAGKGIVAAIVLPPLDIPLIGHDPDVSRDLLLYIVCFAVVAGHVFPLWHAFRGGKGGATAAGLLCYLSPLLALPILAIWILIILSTGFVGLATMSAAVAAAVWVGVTGLPEAAPFFAFATAVALLIIYSHRSNVVRMLRGEESRTGRKSGWR